MSRFSIPAPCIIALRLPMFGGPKSIDTNTKIQLLCETQLNCEIFYTLDGTKPQPYAGIVQGNKTIKYNSPFCLSAGKNTIKAIAINADIHTMCSSVVTKCFQVLKAESTSNLKHTAKTKQLKNKTVKNNLKILYNEEISCCEEVGDAVVNKLNSLSIISQETNCFEEAFIGGSEFETVLSDIEDSIENENGSPAAEFDDDISDKSDDLEEIENFKNLDNVKENDAAENDEKDCAPGSIETFINHEADMDEPNFTSTNISAASTETQFCCVKCDMTLQHCSTCNRMNAVSSKYCIECGKQLTRVCFFCKEHNPGVATFCQYCGKKLNSAQLELSTKVDHSVMAKPRLKNASIQKLTALIDKSTQTITERSPVNKVSPKYLTRLLPRQSPGKGYWHQQLDYICNHLKGHAYNHIEFREEISEPVLRDFKSAHITKGENDITVTITFSPLVTDKNGLSESDGVKSKSST